jgi:hypothetical protein
MLLDLLQAEDRGIKTLEFPCQSGQAPPTEVERDAKNVEREQGECLGQESASEASGLLGFCRWLIRWRVRSRYCSSWRASQA